MFALELPWFALLFEPELFALLLFVGGVNGRNPSFPRFVFAVAGRFVFAAAGRFAAGVATRASFGDMAGA